MKNIQVLVILFSLCFTLSSVGGEYEKSQVDSHEFFQNTQTDCDICNIYSEEYGYGYCDPRCIEVVNLVKQEMQKANSTETAVNEAQKVDMILADYLIKKLDSVSTRLCAYFDNTTGWNTSQGREDCQEQGLLWPLKPMMSAAPIKLLNYDHDAGHLTKMTTHEVKNRVEKNSLSNIRSNVLMLDFNMQAISAPLNKAELLDYARQSVYLSGSLVANPIFSRLKLGQKHYFKCHATLSYGNIIAKNCWIQLSEACRLQQKTKNCPSGNCPFLQAFSPDDTKECSPEAKALGGNFDLSIVLGVDKGNKEDTSYKVMAVLFDSVDDPCCQEVANQ